jgi:hypothetical protein
VLNPSNGQEKFFESDRTGKYVHVLKRWREYFQKKAALDPKAARP